MSAPEFRALFDNQKFKYWFDKALTNKKHPYSSFVHQTRETSKKAIASSTVDFVLTKETLTKLVGESRTSILFKEVNENSINYFDIARYRNIDGQEQLFFPELKFSSLNSSVERFLDLIGKNAGIENVGPQVTAAVSSQELHKGHVFGYSNTLLNLTKEDIRNAGITNSEAELKALDEFIDALIGVLEEYDISTSDIKGLGLQINAKYRKTSSNWLIEWQGSETNVASGNAVNRVLGKTNTTTYSGARGIFTAAVQKNAKEILGNVINKFIQNFVDQSIAAPESSALNLLKQKSSPGMKDMIVDSLVAVISDNHIHKYAKEYKGAIVLPIIPAVTVKLPNKSSLASTVNKLKITKTKIKSSIQKIRQTKTIPRSLSIISLENLLRYNINARVRSNMGVGNATNVLNYRSGRFSESVSIERLSESRQGMISVFYSYMKYPYATFSDGGRQQYPKSRDPKLLISKSIREIAGPMVANRLRSVVV